MEKTLVTTGNSIDEAIEKALAQLGLERDMVSVQVLQQAKAGFLGFGKQQAKVQVSYEAPDPVPEAPKAALSSASRSKPKPAAPKAEPAASSEAAPLVLKPKAPPAEKPAPAQKTESKTEEKAAEPAKNTANAAPAVRREKKERPEQRRRENREPREPKEKATVQAKEPVKQESRQKPMPPYTAPQPGSTEEKIEQFVTGLLQHMGSKAIPQCVNVEGGSYHVELTGEDLGFLIGRRGDTLDAIQHLTNYAINRDVEGHVRVNVDAESYREKREDSLRRYAVKKAQQVLKLRRRTTLEPMNAYERHVIHAALQEMDNITTHSTGVEPNRCVVIEYVR